MDEGFLYVATGGEYIEEARRSAQSVRNHMSDYPIHIITDSEEPGDVFDASHRIADPTFTIDDKTTSLFNTPFERTVYLDTDTILTEPVPELFEMLDHHDICAVHGTGRDFHYPDLDVPRTVPEYNCGVLVYNSGDPMSAFFSDWVELSRKHSEEGVSAEQPGFRQALWESNIDIGTLPPEYNCQLVAPGVLSGTAKILHGRRHRPLSEIESDINRTDRWRVHSPVGDDIGVYSPETASVIRHLWFSLSTRSLLETVRIARRHFRDGS